jgi:hypothetical protein
MLSSQLRSSDSDSMDEPAGLQRVSYVLLSVWVLCGSSCSSLLEGEHVRSLFDDDSYSTRGMQVACARIR